MCGQVLGQVGFGFGFSQNKTRVVSLYFSDSVYKGLSQGYLMENNVLKYVGALEGLFD